MPARLFIFVLLLATATTATVLYLFDRRQATRPPSNQFVLERKIATVVAAGHNVGLPSGLNEAVLRWDTAELLRTAPEIVVLGSSHSLRVSSDMLAARRTMNFSISGGSLPDHWITTALLDARALRPRVWLILVEAWYFDRKTDFGAWQQRGETLRRMEAQLCRAESPALEPVFAPHYTPAAQADARRRYSLEPFVGAFDERVRDAIDRVHIIERPTGSPMRVLRADGAFQAAAEPSQPGALSVLDFALRQFAQNADRHRYGSYAEIDETLWQLFVRWVRYCRQDGAEVWLVLPPYHPAIYGKIIAQPKNQLLRIEQRCREFAPAAEARVFGSYDPALVGIRADDFYDGDHLNEAGLRRLLAPVSAAGTR